MCGICGFALPDPKAPVDSKLLERMTELLLHRGPDGSGYFTGPGIGLGMRRLSIVDLETGDQPIGNEDGSIQVICNGEIYNAPELLSQLSDRGHTLRGHSDVEAIVHLYEEMGMECLKHLRGMFALALWDNNNRTLLLARDRFGIKPFYYGEATDGSLFFGSEAKSILLSGKVDRTLDPVGIAGVMDLGGPLFNRSMFRGVHQLEPGHWLTYRSGSVDTGRYWNLDFAPRDPGSLPKGESEWAEAIHEKLRETVRRHLLGDVPMAAWLSPGIDSSAVACLAAEELGQELKTLSLGFDDPRLDELRHQKTLDQFPEYDFTGDRVPFAGSVLENLSDAVWHQEQPIHFHYSYQVLGDAMEADLKVALTGQGSDELLGGYPWYKGDRRWKNFYWMPAPLRRILADVMPRASETTRRALAGPPRMSRKRFSDLQWTRWAELRSLFNPDLAREVREADAVMEPASLPDGFNGWDRFQQLVYVESKTRMVSYINRGLDASSMAKSVEPRLPFLDHEFAELCMQVPAELRHLKMEKHILRKAMEPYLPQEITWRRKRGLRGPEPTWDPADGPVPEFAQDLLSDEVVRSKGYFRPEVVRAMVQNQEGLDGPLAAVVGFHLWDEQFVQGRGKAL